MIRLSYSAGAAKRVYDRTPVVGQHALTTVYGLRLRQRAYGAAYRRALVQLARSQWLSRQELERRQLGALRSFLCFARDQSPYWRRTFREHGFDPDRMRATGDLRALPPLEKEVVRGRADELVSDAVRDGRLRAVRVHTSGTTGKALHVWVSREAWQREYAFRWLHRSWAGLRRGERMASFAGHPVVPADQDRPPYWRHNLAEDQLIFSSQHLGPETLPACADRLRRFRARLIHGYPSALYLIASRLVHAGDTGVRPRAVFTHSETLLDFQRETIEAAFGCKVFDWYGTTEQVANIVECERGRRHVKLEHSLVEFVRADGTPAQPGEPAELWCTSFCNRAMPLVRYRVGDSAVLAEGECPCGRAGPLVERVLGRVEDFVITPDGRHIGRLDHAFKDALNVYEAQLVQHRVGELDVLIVPRAGFGGADRRALEAELRLRLGSGMRLRVQTVRELARGPNGKLRFVVSKVPPGIGARPAPAPDGPSSPPVLASTRDHGHL